MSFKIFFVGQDREAKNPLEEHLFDNLLGVFVMDHETDCSDLGPGEVFLSKGGKEEVSFSYPQKGNKDEFLVSDPKASFSGPVFDLLKTVEKVETGYMRGSSWMFMFNSSGSKIVEMWGL